MKQKSLFICSECGYNSVKWFGRCPSCGLGGTFLEEVKKNNDNFRNTNLKNLPIKMKEIEIDENIRYKTGIDEFDKILGGGLVKGSLVLIGGAPGIGKSTLLLQIADSINCNKVFYISGEETRQQIKIRGLRLKLELKNLFIISETNMEEIIFHIEDLRPDLVIIDSIQTVQKKDIMSLPGSISQVKECSNILLEFAKRTNVSIIIVSHVNKDGAIAGPKVLEHIVDVVLYFEEFLNR